MTCSLDTMIASKELQSVALCFLVMTIDNMTDGNSSNQTVVVYIILSLHCKKGVVMLTRGLLSELQREFKNEKHSRDVSVMVICFHIPGLRMRT